MKTQIKRLSILQTSKVVAIVSPVFGLFHSGIGAFMLVLGFTLDMPGEERLGLLIPGFILLPMPVFLLFAPFCFSILMCAIYNWIARMIGGIEFELEVQGDASPDPSGTPKMENA